MQTSMQSTIPRVSDPGSASGNLFSGPPPAAAAAAPAADPPAQTVAAKDGSDSKEEEGTLRVLQRMNVAYKDELASELESYVQQLNMLAEKSRRRAEIMFKDLKVINKGLSDTVGSANDAIKKSTGASKEVLCEFKTRRILKSIESCKKLFYTFYRFHMNFITRTFREPLSVIRAYGNDPRISAVDVQAAVSTVTNIIRKTKEYYISSFKSVFENQDVGMGTFLDEDQVAEIQKTKNDVIDEVELMSDKIQSLYSSKKSLGLIEMLSDTQFSLLYFMKLLRLGSLWLSVFLAGSIFTNQYVDKVFSKKEAPPPLVVFVLLVTGIDFALNALMFSVLYLMKRILTKSSDSFVLLDASFMTRYIVDYVVYATLFTVIGVLLAEVIRRKPVFNYQTDGVQPISAFKNMLFALGGFVLIVPFFLLTN